MSVFSGLSRPMRAAGLGLVAVAVVAAVIGGISLTTGGGDDKDTAAPAESSATPLPSRPGDASRPAEPTSSESSSATSEPNTPSAEPGEEQGDGTNGRDSGDGTDDGTNGGRGRDGADGTNGGQNGADGQNRQASAKWVGVRLYNNSTIKGLAHEAAEDLRGRGWNVVGVDNYSSGVIPATTAYFRRGTDEETAAKALAKEFGIRAEQRFDGIKDSSPGVIVIVTKDYEGEVGK